MPGATSSFLFLVAMASNGRTGRRSGRRNLRRSVREMLERTGRRYDPPGKGDGTEANEESFVEALRSIEREAFDSSPVEH